MELRLSSGHTVYRLVIIGSLQIVNARHFLQSWKQVVGVGKLSVYFDSSGWLFPLLSPLSCFPWLSSLMEASLKRVGINKICMLFFLANDSMKTSSTFKFGLSQRWALGNITCLILGAGWSLLPSPRQSGQVAFHSDISTLLSDGGAQLTNCGSQPGPDRTWLSESGSLNYSFSFLIPLFISNSCCVFGASCQLSA